MSVALPVVGALLVLVVLREVFHTLFHPSGQGGLTMLAFRAVWGLTGRAGAGARSLAGPLAIALVIALWVAGLVVGFALVYWPSMPESFIYSETLEPAAEDGFVDAVYYSWVTQATLGYGTIAPEQGVFRILGPLQATLGFAVFTLVVTWVLSVYPALHRQRAIASRTEAIRRAHDRDGGARSLHPATLARQMGDLSSGINAVRVDFVQYPSTFYFAAPADTLDLAGALPYAAAIARTEGLADEARPAAAELGASLDLLAASLGEQHLGMREAATDEVLRAYRRHQGHAPEPRT